MNTNIYLNVNKDLNAEGADIVAVVVPMTGSTDATMADFTIVEFTKTDFAKICADDLVSWQDCTEACKIRMGYKKNKKEMRSKRGTTVYWRKVAVRTYSGRVETVCTNADWQEFLAKHTYSGYKNHGFAAEEVASVWYGVPILKGEGVDLIDKEGRRIEVKWYDGFQLTL